MEYRRSTTVQVYHDKHPLTARPVRHGTPQPAFSQRQYRVQVPPCPQTGRTLSGKWRPVYSTPPTPPGVLRRDLHIVTIEDNVGQNMRKQQRLH